MAKEREREREREREKFRERSTEIKNKSKIKARNNTYYIDRQFNNGDANKQLTAKHLLQKISLQPRFEHQI